MDEVQINWRGSFTWEELTEEEEEGYEYEEEIYAIAWEPPKSDKRTRYIGIAINQYIAERLKGYHEGDNWLFEQHGTRNIRYYLGRILLKEGQRTSTKRTLDVEAAMIYYHYNHEDICGANVQSTSNYYGRDIEIRNSGEVPPGIVDFRNVGDDWIKI